jgi:hypothetical protein
VAFLVAGLLLLAPVFSPGQGAGPAPDNALLPAGVTAVWDLKKAHRDTTATRERVCLNGLWRWQPAEAGASAVPAGRWGWFPVPGFWPGNTSYIQDDTQTLHAHPSWKGTIARGTGAAWYQREFTVPKEWAGRRISLVADYLSSFAVVHVDGKKAGEMRYPSGEVDLTSLCRPGGKHVLSALVEALPLNGVLLSYSDTNSARKVKGTVQRRGLCGDVYLVSTPAAARIADVKVDTSVRKGEIAFSAALEGLQVGTSYALRAVVREQDGARHTFTSRRFRPGDLEGSRFAFAQKWKPEKLWDVHTPGNLCHAQVALLEAPDRVLDDYYPVRFGFRELWIDGRDFYLNGTRLYLSAVPLDNAQISARTASYAGARETLKRLQSFGINLVYTHNYGCEPGSHVSFAEVLRAADDAGMLVAFSQPHFGHYQWKAPDADRGNGYARHAAFFVREAQNHPSVVAYAMSHNATGYAEDMNPDLLAGKRDPRDTWAQGNARLALRAEAIVKGLDPSRIVYHHSSGNLGSMHTINFYANFVPIQEMSDWFETWSGKGVKPVFLCEYGVPFSWDWTMYRGWYKGERSFGSARVPWEFCLAEWNASFHGDRAFRISEKEKANLRWEAGQFRAGRLWHRWDYPHAVGASDFDERQEVFAAYITDNWRTHRTWGLSANSPWEYAAFWKLRDGVGTGCKDLPVDWESLQRPGFSPDFVSPRKGWMSVDHKRSDWVPTAAAQALLRNNQSLLGYIAGKPSSFTSKDHNFLPGETIDKQLVVINNSRQPVTCRCEHSLNLPRPVSASKKISVPAGAQERIPLRFDLPASLPAGRYELKATFHFADGEAQEDAFSLHVLPRPADAPAGAKIALFDPTGETARLLTGMNVRFQRVEAGDDLSLYEILIIGKGALTAAGPGPDVRRVRDGLKVVVFEQSAEALEERFGFRVAEHGLRQLFGRVPDHPLLAGLKPEHLRDWRGEATLLPPRLRYTLRPRRGPTVRWCGIEVPRAWRCGCRGNVASVLIEKPARGDFLPIVDGGYGLQYSLLLEHREGKGLVLFCQMDVTGRTESEPAADLLVRNIMRYVLEWKPRPERKVLYAGEPEGKKHLEAAGVSPRPFTREALGDDCVLIVGPGGARRLAADAAAIGKWVEGGGHLLAVGLDGEESRVLLPAKVQTRREEHIAAWFAPFGHRTLLAGVGPADVHNRDPRQLPLVCGGAEVVGNGVLARSTRGNVVFCQLVPWQFAHDRQMNLKRTFRCAARLVARLAANMGARGATPLLARFGNPVKGAKPEQRWLEGLYLDVPEEWDDPYRFFRW